MSVNDLQKLKLNLDRARWDDYVADISSGSENPKLTLTMLTSLLLLWNNCLCLAWFQNGTDGKQILDFLLRFHLVYIQHQYRDGHGALAEQHYICTLTRLGVEYIQYCHLDTLFDSLLNKSSDYIPVIKVPSKNNTKKPKTYVRFSNGGASIFIIVGDIIICTLCFLLLMLLHLTILGGLMFLVSFFVIRVLTRVVHFLDPQSDIGQVSRHRNHLIELSMYQPGILSDSIKKQLKHAYRNNNSYRDTELDLIRFIYLHQKLPKLTDVDSLIRTMTYFVFVPMNHNDIHFWFPMFPI